MALWLDAFDRVLKEIKEMISKNKEKEQKAFAACEAIQKAANRTSEFLQTHSKTSSKPNLALSDIWLDAAKAVRELDSGMYNRLLSKAEYWSNPNDWTDEKIEAANIRLDTIRKDSRKISSEKSK
jgi:hypothetical protein